MSDTTFPLPPDRGDDGPTGGSILWVLGALFVVVTALAWSCVPAVPQ